MGLLEKIKLKDNIILSLLMRSCCVNPTFSVFIDFYECHSFILTVFDNTSDDHCKSYKKSNMFSSNCWLAITSLHK